VYVKCPHTLGTYNAAVTLKDKVRLVLENGAAGITVTIDSGATASLEDFHNFDFKRWDSGVLVGFQEDRSEADTASYAVFKEGSFYFAVNQTAGSVDYSGTNCTTVINSALDDGATVYLKAATYNITAPILMNENNTLLGDGSSTILKLHDNTNRNMVEASSVNFIRIANIKFDQNRDQQTFNSFVCIYCDTVNFSTIENNYFENVRYSSINFIQGGGMSYHNTIRNNKARYSTNTLVAIQGSFNLIEGNTAYYCGGYAYYARQSVYGNTWIGNSAFYNDTQAGDAESLGMGIGESGVSAYNQTVIGGEFGFLSRDGINVYNGSGSLIQGVNCHDNGRYGITVGSSNITIVGAQVHHNGEWGIYVVHDGTTISGANIHHNTKDGIRIASSSNYTTIEGCLIWANGETGIEDYGWSTIVANTQLLTNGAGGYNQATGSGQLSLIVGVIAMENTGGLNIKMRSTGSYICHSYNGTDYVSEAAGSP